MYQEVPLLSRLRLKRWYKRGGSPGRLLSGLTLLGLSATPPYRMPKVRLQVTLLLFQAVCTVGASCCPDPAICLGILSTCQLIAC